MGGVSLNKFLKKTALALSIALLLGLALWGIQTQRFNYEMNSKFSTSHNWQPTLPIVRSLVSDILDGEQRYAQLHRLCYAISVESHEAGYYSTEYALKLNQYFFTRTLKYGERQSLTLPDDIVACQEATMTLYLCFNYLAEQALTFESKGVSAKDKELLQEVLVVISQLEAAVLSAELPQEIQTKNDVASYLGFFRDNAALIRDFHNIILLH